MTWKCASHQSDPIKAAAALNHELYTGKSWERRVLALGRITGVITRHQTTGIKDLAMSNCYWRMKKRELCWNEGCRSGSQWKDRGSDRFLGRHGQRCPRSLSPFQLCLSIAHWQQGTAVEVESSSDVAPTGVPPQQLT